MTKLKTDSCGISFWTRYWILEYLSLLRLQVAWQDSLSNSFEPASRVRQGDRLSSYLFVLCMESLAHLIDLEIKMKDESHLPKER